MVEVVGISFKKSGKVYYFAPGEIKIEKGSHVIVETARGLEFGYVSLGNTFVDEQKIVAPLKKVIRIATEKDVQNDKANREKEKDAFGVCEEKIKKHNLDMKLVDVEYTFDGSKILFYFTADGRVDFRELVKDLASAFRTRIELRQIGVRDESKMLGGVGICGQAYCCARFLNDFQPVSIKMAKEQGLSLNPTKISGACGRLMCCLKYEQEAYEDLIRKTPKQGAIVKTPDGEGVVVDVNILRGRLKVKLKSDLPDAAPKEYCRKQLSVIKEGKMIKEEKIDFDELKKLEDK